MLKNEMYTIKQSNNNNERVIKNRMEDKLITCSNYKSKIQLYESEMKIIEESLLTKNNSVDWWD